MSQIKYIQEIFTLEIRNSVNVRCIMGQEDQDVNMVTKKKLPAWVKLIIGIVVFFLVLTLAAYAYIQHTLNKINKADQVEVVEPQEEYFEIDSDLKSDLVEMDPNNIEWDIDEDIMQDKDIVNILLIGQDRREGEGRARSDAMILVTINKKKGTIQLTSFMRDLYVQIPGYSDNRINASYAFGGMELLNKTIAADFGIQIDGNIEVDFSGFQTAIDLIDGIDMELTQAEADYLNKSGNWDVSDSANAWSLVAGVNHLNGEQALAFSRIRYIGNSDYERTDRQRRVLMTAFSKMKSSDIGTILNLIDEVFPLLTTDISQRSLFGYAVTVLSMGVSELESYRIPIYGGYQPAIIRQMQVLVPDLAVNREYLRQILYGE